MFKKIFTVLMLVLFTTTALAYGPEKQYDPDATDGTKVYRGYIINHSPDKYLLIKICDKSEPSVIIYNFQIQPERPVEMPYKKHGNGYIPDLKAYKDLLEKYYQDHGNALWVRNIVLKEGTYIIRYKWSHEPESEWKEKEFQLTSFMATTMGGPYLIEVFDD